jgi:biopolymer transport protein ExbB
MLSRLFLGLSLVGAEWVLYLLILLSILSIGIIIERLLFYRQAMNGLAEFRAKLQAGVASGNPTGAVEAAKGRTDLDSQVALALLSRSKASTDVMNELATEAVSRARLPWERNLAILATIGSNSPFVGLFGTVLGIIKAFHDLQSTAGAGVQAVSSGISEALVATAVGILVAIPAVVAFNIFQRRVKVALTEAEAMKSYLIAKLAG